MTVVCLSVSVLLLSGAHLFTAMNVRDLARRVRELERRPPLA